jgi:hypothetical protein
MDKKYTQPDQDNQNMKMKFISNDRYEAPLFRNICDFQNESSVMYGADGRVRKQKISMTTEYTKNSKGFIDDDEMDNDFDAAYFPGFSTLNTPCKGSLFSAEEIVEDEMMSKKHNKIGKDEKNYRYNREVSCSEKSRYIDQSSYIRGGSMETGGFSNNLDRFSALKQGNATRNIQDTIADEEIDRFHFTFRNFQHPHTGSNPLPEDTRHRNKSYK